MLSGGEVLAPALAHAMARLAPAAIHDLYGLTETGSCDFHLGPAGQPQGFGTIGHPTERVMFRIENGELQIRTPFGMLGYLDGHRADRSLVRGRLFQDRRPGAAEGGRCRRADRARRKDIVSRGGIEVARASRSTTCWRSTRRSPRRSAPALRTSASAKSFTPSSSRAPAPAWMPKPCATGCWRVPNASRCRTFSTSATRCPQAPSGKADRRAVAQLAAQPGNRR